MGQLVNGKWQGKFFEVDTENGRFVRQDSIFRNWIRADGSTRFPPEAGRYHLYVAHACPWAHRTLIFRALKELEDAVSVSYVQPHMGDDGWTFADDNSLNTDSINGKRFYPVGQAVANRRQQRIIRDHPNVQQRIPGLYR